MRSFTLVLVLVALAAAAPKRTKLNYRNLYKPLIHGVKPHPGSRIVGGQEAPPHSLPYQAFLDVYAFGGGWYCGGSLISENYVLTAGHCADDAYKVDVTLGAHKLLTEEETQVHLSSVEITVNNNYDYEDVVNDIAVIKLSSPVPLNDAIQPVVLPTLSEVKNNFAGNTARISGWGLTDGNGNAMSSVLNYVDVEVISNDECEEAFGKLPLSVVCTSGKNNSGACNGDSGGPLVLNNVQIGIVSYGAEYCPPGSPSAFTRVTSFLDWIAKHTDAVVR